jgi:hypothetical protein
MEETASGCLEVTCLECKASILVLAHAAYKNGCLTNQITMKKSMHKQTCSLSMEPAKQASIAKLPSKGNKINIIKKTFEAKAT